jgi:hypothetical protein
MNQRKVNLNCCRLYLRKSYSKSLNYYTKLSGRFMSDKFFDDQTMKRIRFRNNIWKIRKIERWIKHEGFQRGSSLCFCNVFYLFSVWLQICISGSHGHCNGDWNWVGHICFMLMLNNWTKPQEYLNITTLINQHWKYCFRKRQRKLSRLVCQFQVTTV